MSPLDPDKITSKIADTLTDTAKEALYLGVGFGVLGAQRLQVHRQELRKQFASQLEAGRQRFSQLATTFEQRATAVEGRVDEVLDGVQSRLPGQIAEVFAGARAAAKAGRDRLRVA
jgi:hypothetical protein